MRTYEFNMANPIEAARVSATVEEILKVLGVLTLQSEYAGSWSEVLTAIAVVYAKFASQLVPLDVAQALIEASWEGPVVSRPIDPNAS